MKGNTLIWTQVSVDINRLLKSIKGELIEEEMKKKNRGKRITKKEACEELYNRYKETQ